MPATGEPSISVVIVTYNEQEAMRRCLPFVVETLRDGDELIISDNASSDDTLAIVKEIAPQAKIVQNGGNLGFPAAANSGAEAATKDLLLLLNPDAKPESGFAEAIRRPALDGRGWAAWMGLVAMDGGRAINTDGNIVHFTGITWAGSLGRPTETHAAAGEVACLSGACLAIPRDTWEKIGAMPGEFFLYCDDVDISLRLRLRGERFGIEPSACVEHDYEFGRRPSKWRYLERNRAAVVIRTYPSGLLAALAPALLATELALIPISIGSGWGGQKLRANLDVLRSLPRLLRERRSIQASRTVSSAQFARWLSADLDSPLLGAVGKSRLIRMSLRAYWRVARLLLGSSARS